MNEFRWRVLWWTLLVIWVVCAVLEVTSAGPYLPRAYGADIAIPAWLYISTRSLDNRDRKRVIRRYLGRTPETAAVLLLLASTGTELSQRFWPNGLFPGHFDWLDIAAFAAGIGLCYALDKRYPNRIRPKDIKGTKAA